MLAAYLVASSLLLAIVASIWSSKGWPNIFFKAAFVAAALTGAVCVAKYVVLP